MWDIFKDYLSAFIGVIVLGIGMFFIPEIQKNVKRIIYLIFGCLLLFWLGCDKVGRDNRDKKTAEIQHLNDSVKIAELIASVNQLSIGGTQNKKEILNSNDSTRQAVIDSLETLGLLINNRFDNAAKNNVKTIPLQPLLGLTGYPDRDNPRLTLDKKRGKIDVSLSNFGNDPALNISEKNFSFFLKENGQLDTVIGFRQAFNKSDVIPNSKDFIYELSYWYHYRNPDLDFPVTDTLFIYSKVLYTNSQGKPMPPKRMIYFIIGSKIVNAPAYIYDRVEDIIKAHHSW